ncbi:MAG: DUF1285 domain-containing protein [Pseudomonas sp.]|jgi:hypothetical protein|nr:DUF1285 domain-containing protein [Pseudomonas sp.]|tara:strand:+ start:4356 stop:4934 length:579 start_codon:yes stop_codon:yes gene_type:complete
MTRRQPPHQSLLASIPGASSTRRPSPAPVDQWDPPVSGEMDMQIVRDGTWYHEGDPINRMALAQLFASILRLDDDGRYYLVTPVERWAIQVDDKPFVATQLKVEGEGEEQKLTFTTNLEDSVEADPEHPIRVELDPDTQEPSPYVLVRGNLEALIGRNVFYQLVELAVEREHHGKTCLGVWSHGSFFPIDGN